MPTKFNSLAFRVDLVKMEIPIHLTVAFLRKSYAKRLFRNWWKLLIAALMISVSVVPDFLSGHLGTVSVFGLSAMAFCILTLPTNQVPPEALDFLIQQFRTRGMKVEDSRKTRG